MSVDIQGFAVAGDDQVAVARPEPVEPSPQPAGGSPRARRFVRVGGLGGVCLILGAALGVLTETAWPARPNVVVVTAAPFTVSGPSPVSMLARLVDAVQPSVASITVTSPSEMDVGTGVVVSREGMILTANHVVANAGKITVHFADGRADAAQIVGRAPGSDLAVIRVAKLRGLVPATFGSAKYLQTGDEVLVLGNPLGLAGTVTRGIVSALHRSVPVDANSSQPHVDPLLGLPERVPPTGFIREAIQTDAIVKPGNSGGPLVDMQGHVIGIVCSVAWDESGLAPDTGLAFAIPSDTAWPTAIRLMARG